MGKKEKPNWPQESRRIVGDSVRDRWNSYSKQQRDQIRDKMAATKIKMVGGKRPAIFVSPDGKQHQVFNIRRFCIEHNLSVSSMFDLKSGRSKSHKGWTVLGVSKERKEYTPRDVVKYIISPKGKEFIMVNVSKFCKKHRLNQSCVNRVINGIQSNHKGWTRKPYTVR